MTSRYNPHQLEKYANRTFGTATDTLFSLFDDVVQRVSLLRQAEPLPLLGPFTANLMVSEALLSEYGHDATRIAQISSQNQSPKLAQLESATKWLARLDYASKNKASGPTPFSARPWLTAILQGYDQVVRRQQPHLGLSLVRRAFRLSPPTADISGREQALIRSCLFPWCPVWVSCYPKVSVQPPNTVNEVCAMFPELICLRLALPAGGWHWQILNRAEFEREPVNELKRIKWIKKAAGNKDISLQKVAEGVRLCLS